MGVWSGPECIASTSVIIRTNLIFGRPAKFSLRNTQNLSRTRRKAWICEHLGGRARSAKGCTIKPTRAERTCYVRCGPKGLGNLAQASAWVGFTPTTASPVGAEECLSISINPKHNVRRNSLAGISKTHSRSIRPWSDAPTGLPLG
jgi:hypothetical protein